MVKQSDYTIGVITHILAYFTWFVGPLIVLLASENVFAKQNARTALNWQISLSIYCLVSMVLVFVLIGIPLLIALGVLNIIFCVVAAVKASEGKVWPYPGAIPFFKER
jgi:uncharacterized Tic20 family protein